MKKKNIFECKTVEDIKSLFMEKENKKIFLGGTCNESAWRDELIEGINTDKYDYFNPVVDDWSEDDYKKELKEREDCDICLYVITPEMTGVYSIAEVVDDSNKRPDKTVFCFLNKYNDKSFDKGQLKSLSKVGKMISNNGGKSFDSFKDLKEFFK